MDKNYFNTPVLFLIFNRPDTTQQVFDRIKEIKPAKLFVSADGPREGKNEDSKCEVARDIVKQVNWECDVKTNFSEKNLGCKKAVSSGINWFFQNVDEGIILEDDCLPDLSFFSFCSQMLEKYRADDRVMHIGGTNFQDGIQRGTGSYYFSRLVHVWGWATWKRAWEKYDVEIKFFENFVKLGCIKEIFTDKKQQDFWLKTFELVYSNKKDTWDFQWMFTVMVNNGISIIPNENLVSNLGFGENATHTTLSGSPAANIKTGAIDKFVSSEFMIPNRTADDYTFRRYIAPGKLNKLLQVLTSKIKN